ncbi:MAG: hypothetical protein ACRES4_07305 [Nevskiales bacterium]
METVHTVSLPIKLIEEAKAITGKRTPRAAFKSLIALDYLPVQVREPERQLRAGKGKRFRSAGKALEWLES